MSLLFHGFLQESLMNRVWSFTTLTFLGDLMIYSFYRLSNKHSKCLRIRKIRFFKKALMEHESKTIMKWNNTLWHGFFIFLVLNEQYWTSIVSYFSGHPWDDLIPTLLDITAKYRLKLSFHMEPYKHRSSESLRTDIEYIIDNYGNHSALYRMKRSKSRKSK